MRRSNTRQCQALCVRLPEASGPSFVSSHYIQESPGGERDWPAGKGLEAVGAGHADSPDNDFTSHLAGVSLEGSELVFPDLVQLICSYSHTR